ncbi:MAG: amidohydrolase family protein [Gemmatimonadetes bacterium]|nr:amidohydrolase family protein [Gemmatimonadota bacterium]
MRRLLVLAVLILAACGGPGYDVIIRHGTVYDGSGQPGVVADVGIRGDSIVAVGDLSGAKGKEEVDATGLAVAPGFINMLSWAPEALLIDGRSQSDLRQGVTLEVFGEGASMGLWSDSMKAEAKASQGAIRYDLTWTTLGQYLDTVVKKGIATNVASFVGAATVRQHVLGHAARAATPEELAQMVALVRQAMGEGALGVGSSLIYEPGMFATTDELVALAAAAGDSGGMYISHIRNENDSLLDAAAEFLDIVRRSGARGEVYHLKAAGRDNWDKLDSLLALLEAARAEGLKVTADMYSYPASSTGLDAIMPGWVREGGYEAWRARLLNPADRRKLLAYWRERGGAFRGPGGPEGVLLVDFKNDSLRKYTGKRLSEVAALRGTSPEETAMDLVAQDGSRVGCVYFTMLEDNLRKEVVLPWMAFSSDASSIAPEGVFLKSNPHPRTYGSFARVLAKYVREEKLVPLEEAIRRLSAFPAENLGLARRGRLVPGYFADVVVFDPATIQDHATFDAPHQYATGVKQVFVNGTRVIRDGEHTGAMPGRVVRRARTGR